MSIKYFEHVETILYLSRVVRKPAFCICKNKDEDQLVVTAKLISAFVFAIRIVQSLYFLNPKFQASSRLVWLYSLVCVGPGQKPRKPVFSQQGSFNKVSLNQKVLYKFLVTVIDFWPLYALIISIDCRYLIWYTRTILFYGASIISASFNLLSKRI